MGEPLSVPLQIGAALLALTPGHGELLRESSRAWRSVTFSGHRVAAAIRYVGVEAAIMGEALLEELAETELHSLGKVVLAELVVASTLRESQPVAALTIEFEALTLDMPLGNTVGAA